MILKAQIIKNRLPCIFQATGNILLQKVHIQCAQAIEPKG